MRDIKFRAIDNDGEWCYGLPNYDLDGDIEMSKPDGYTSYGDIDKTLGQYTGLKDKNGVDIYEGDIVKWGHIDGFTERNPRVAIVEMEIDLSFMTINLGENNHRFRYGNFMYKNTQDAMEVIGNIHQNPELLEQK